METIANLGAIDKLQRRNASFIEYFFVGTEKDIFWLLSLCNIAMSSLRFNYNSFRWIIEFFCNVFFLLYSRCRCCCCLYCSPLPSALLFWSFVHSFFRLLVLRLNLYFDLHFFGMILCYVESASSDSRDSSQHHLRPRPLFFGSRISFSTYDLFFIFPLRFKLRNHSSW